jgi:hypothetical protein
MFKLLILALTMLIASCGGGGGFSGTPNGPSATLRVFPPVSTITVPVGYSYATVEIQGGRPPYVVTSSTAAVGASVVNGNKLQVTGFQAGTSEVAVIDQERVVVKIQVTATLVPMKSTIGTDVSVRPNQAVTFDIYGGVGPYVVRSNNNLIATVAPSQTPSWGPFVVTGLTQGTTTLTVTDSTDTEFVITVNVVSTPITVTPAAGAGKAGTSIVLTLLGGQQPYSVSSLDSSIADAVVSGNAITVTLKKKGSTKLLINDGQGVLKEVDITVDDSSLAVAPAVVQTFTSAPVSFHMSGGVAPFIPVVSNPSAISSITFSDDNSEMLVTPNIPVGNPAGCFANITTTITVFDQTGSSRSVSLTITQSPNAVCP